MASSRPGAGTLKRPPFDAPSAGAPGTGGPKRSPFAASAAGAGKASRLTQAAQAVVQSQRKYSVLAAILVLHTVQCGLPFFCVTLVAIVCPALHFGAAAAGSAGATSVGAGTAAKSGATFLHHTIITRPPSFYQQQQMAHTGVQRRQGSCRRSSSPSGPHPLRGDTLLPAADC